MSFSNLWYASYWFGQPAPAAKVSLVLWLVLLLGSVLASLILLFLRYYTSERTRYLVYSRWSNFLLTMGVVGLFLFFFRQSHVVLLGWRMWFLPWFVVSAVWLYRLIAYTFKRVPTIKVEQALQARQARYMPR